MDLLVTLSKAVGDANSTKELDRTEVKGLLVDYCATWGINASAE